VQNSETFDYIIVGAGSAGCVLANRLTASGRHRVLLLEAGPKNRHPWLHIPLGFGRLFNNRRFNWCYETEPQPGCHNRKVIAPRGRVLGGSSSINGLVYIRGQAEDFNVWRQLGNTGWSFEEVLPYFRKAEDNERGADQFHGVGGPLAVSDLCDRHPLAEAFVEAAVQCGYPRNDDFNASLQEGAGYYQTTMRNGLRSSTAAAYLKPASRRANLKVVSEALATRIVFEGRRVTRRGYLAIPAVSAGCFLRAHPTSATPDSQCSISLFSAQTIGGELHPFPGVTGNCVLLRPESRGYVQITSADPRDAPAINPNYLATQKDSETIVAGVAAMRRIFKAPAMARYIAEEIEPGPRCDDGDELLDFIRRRGSTTYHPVGTCRMGQDQKAVVDERLRVRGFTGLRVIDASIMPAVVSGNTNAATIMIGEKGADMIIEDAKRGL